MAGRIRPPLLLVLVYVLLHHQCEVRDVGGRGVARARCRHNYGVAACGCADNVVVAATGKGEGHRQKGKPKNCSNLAPSAFPATCSQEHAEDAESAQTLPEIRVGRV